MSARDLVIVHRRAAALGLPVAVVDRELDVVASGRLRRWGRAVLELDTDAGVVTLDPRGLTVVAKRAPR